MAIALTDARDAAADPAERVAPGKQGDDRVGAGDTHIVPHAQRVVRAGVECAGDLAQRARLVVAQRQPAAENRHILRLLHGVHERAAAVGVGKNGQLRAGKAHFAQQFARLRLRRAGRGFARQHRLKAPARAECAAPGGGGEILCIARGVLLQQHRLPQKRPGGGVCGALRVGELQHAQSTADGQRLRRQLHAVFGKERLKPVIDRLPLLPLGKARRHDQQQQKRRRQRQNEQNQIFEL